MDRRLKSYLTQAVYDYCIHHRLDPYLVVAVGGSSKLPSEYADARTVTLNLGGSAIRDFRIADGRMSFNARFAGVVHEVIIDLDEIVWMGVPDTDDGISFIVQRDAGEDSESLDAQQPGSRGQAAQERQIGNRRLKLL